jgi:tripartite-type tricarboxylate transporter receptor subunit TctC
MSRLRTLAATLAALSLSLASVVAASAEAYPTRPIKMIVPTPAGGPVDVIARLIGNYLASSLGQAVVIDNRPGAGNTIGSKEAAQAEPDGYTLLRDVNFSSGGIGVLPHLIGEWFKSAASIDIVHVPYRGGGPSINDLLAGQVQMTFEGTSVLLPLIRSGKLRALATTSAKRISELPDLPTMVESGFPGFVSTSWTGLLAPVRTPRVVIDRLNAQINEGLDSPQLRSALTTLSNQPLGGTPQDFTELMKSENGKWAPIVKALALKPD